MIILGAQYVQSAGGGPAVTVRVDSDNGTWFARVIDGAVQSGGMAGEALAAWIAAGNTITPAGE